jgi:hypothetical protein
MSTSRADKGRRSPPSWTPIREWSLPPKPSFAHPDPEGLPEWMPRNLDPRSTDWSLQGAFGSWSPHDTRREPYTWDADVWVTQDGSVRLILLADRGGEHYYRLKDSFNPMAEAEELFRWLSGLVVWDLGSIHTRLTAAGYQIDS